MKTHLFLEIELEIDYDPCPAEPMTRHYPGSPEHVEVNTILMYGIELPVELLNKIKAEHDEIEEWCEDDARNARAESATERAVCEAEHKREWIRDR